MSEWTAWDVIEGALTKTRRLLFEPFDLGMWVKLAIILFFIGAGGSNFGYNSSSGNFGGSDDFKCFDDNEFDETVKGIVSEMPAFMRQIRYLIALAALLILLVIILFSYISCAMEFVFVESVVNNTVTIGTYIRNNLGNALQLFVLRWILGITFLIAIILSLLPALSSIFKEDFSIVFFGSLFMFFTVVAIGSVILVIMGSFINLAIPVMLYENVGIMGALAKVVGTATRSIPQLLLYWVLRILLGIVVGIVAVIIAIIVGLLALLIMAVIGIAVYLILSLLGMDFSSVTLLVLLVPGIIIALFVLAFLITLATVPCPVFMKYHALLFLQGWYADIVPFQDVGAGPDVAVDVVVETEMVENGD
jgi:hypothetical protein